MPYEADDYLSRHFQTSGTDLARKVDELAALAAPGDSPNLALYREMLFTVTRMAQADRNRWDAKIMLQTLREMEHAFSVLEQFKRRRKVTVFGSARTPVEHPVYALARKLGEELARYDLMVITGAGGASWPPPTKAPGWRTAWASTSPCPSSSTPTIRWTAAATCCRSLLLPAQAVLRQGSRRPGALPRRLRHPRRGAGSADPGADRQEPAGADRAARPAGRPLLGTRPGVHAGTVAGESLYPAGRHAPDAPGAFGRRRGEGNRPVLPQLPLQPLAERHFRDSPEPRP